MRPPDLRAPKAKRRTTPGAGRLPSWRAALKGWRWPVPFKAGLPPWGARWLWGLVPLTLAIAGGILAGRLILPATAEQRLKAALVEAGFPDAQVTVRHAGWGWLEAGVRLQAGLEADTALVTFAGLVPWGRPARLALTGISLDAGHLDGQALARLTDLPIDHVDIGSAQLIHGDWSMPLALHAALDRTAGDAPAAGAWQGQAVMEPAAGWPALAVTVSLTQTADGPALRLAAAPGATPMVSGTLVAGPKGTVKAELTVTDLRVRDWGGPMSAHLAAQGDGDRWTVSATAETPDAHLALEGARPWIGMQGAMPAAPWGLTLRARGAGTWSGEGLLTVAGTAEGGTLAVTVAADGMTAPELPLMAAFLNAGGNLKPEGDGAWRLDLTRPAQVGGRLRDGQGTPVSLGWDPGADGHFAVTWRGGWGKERRGHAEARGALVGRLGPAATPLIAGGTTGLRVTADWDAGGLSALEASAEAVQAPALLGGTLEGAHLSGGFDRANRANPWQLTLDGGRVQGTMLPPLALAVTLSGDPAATLTLAGQARGLGTPLVLGLSGHWTASERRGEAAAVLEPLTLSTVPDLARLLPGTGLTGPVQGLGTVAGRARLSWEQGRLTGSGEVRADAVSLAGPSLAIDGLKGLVALDGLFPLHSPPAQHIEAKAVRAALAVEDVGLDFQLAEGRVLLQGGDLAWAGGHVHLSPEEGGGFSATVAEVDLAQALPAWAAAGYTLQGKLGGRLLGRFDGMAPVLAFGGLQAEAPGHIGYADTTGAGVPVVLNPDHNGKVALVTRALADYDYQALTLEPKGPILTDPRARLLLRGVNPGFYGGYPVDLDLELDAGDLSASGGQGR
ncbi:YdbH domain-containing protein [Nitrospirillum sp. BR 11164]|uniref:intermembrane phospholipid transport protein YdbH family protein n=1 Tax=Nitrospirillum sp. BR 11164 TaxID=3104324 RepID=UPI002AFFA21B|nr:YdbH domain-containing protein [Nitrospirillum sp. BR 11164]MEA1650619.1 YdbH domain-containing protein [Nitrospirillum sp. BR 11164]